jgi:L-gulono-1,4-lactone dehydrogenase
MPGKGILGGIIDVISGFFPGKARSLFDQLKAKPGDKDLTEKVKELFKKNPVAVGAEIIRRVNIAPKKTTPVNDFKELRQTWENTIHRERVQPLQYLRPTLKQQLVDAVKMAESKGLLVRAVGMGHSFSDVANATDVLVDMLGINKTLPVELDTLKANAPVVFNAEAGMLVEKLNTELDVLGLALPTMAAFDQETIYGAIATSTHGTGLNVAGMPGMLRSMDIIAAGGQCYRLEPANGITDPVKFKAKYPNNEIILIQEEDKFNSAVVGFGLMGIVYSVVIEPVKAFYLMQRLWVTDWETVKPKLKDRSFFTAINDKWANIKPIPGTNQFPPTRAQVFVNPYITNHITTKKPGHTCVVQIQTEITKAEFDALKNKVEKKRVNKIVAFLQELATNGALGEHFVDAATEDKNSIIEEIGTDALLVLLNEFPSLTPLFLDISMIVLLSGSGKFGKSYAVMNQGKLAVKNAGYSVEPGFAVDEKNNFIKGAEEIIRVALLSETFISYLTSPMCMRFVQKSSDYLSPEYDADTCMIDVPLMLGTIGDNQMLDRLQLDTVALGARPHWGKICNLVNGEELIRKMYPKFDQFAETVRFFNPKGTFNSSFSYRTGISKMVYERD